MKLNQNYKKLVFSKLYHNFKLFYCQSYHCCFYDHLLVSNYFIIFLDFLKRFWFKKFKIKFFMVVILTTLSIQFQIKFN